jgi:hypothetical protein
MSDAMPTICGMTTPEPPLEISVEMTRAELVAAVVAKAVANGRSMDDFDEIVDHLDSALETSTVDGLLRVAEELDRRRDEVLAAWRKDLRGFRRRLRKYWGQALDDMFLVIVGTEEMAAKFDQERRTDEPLFEALTDLMARACRVAREVHSLLESGFPLGALARSRTLHEIAIVCRVLETYDGQPGTEDLAERYLLHVGVLDHSDAETYRRDHAFWGNDDIEEEDWAAIQERRDKLVKRFGRPFLQQYGWAQPLLAGLSERGMAGLELLVDEAQRRGHYKWVSHEVHADAKSGHLNKIERDGVVYRLSGPTNIRFEDPAWLALDSLRMTSESLFMSRYASIGELLTVGALLYLTERTGSLFIAGGEAVHAAEDKFQARGPKPAPS